MTSKLITLLWMPTMIAFFVGCGSRAKDEAVKSTVKREKPVHMEHEFTIEFIPHSDKTQQQVVKVLKSRLRNYGLRSFQVEPRGNNRIIVQISGLSQAKREEAKRTIQRAAILRFHLVHPGYDERAGLEMDGYTNLVRTFKDMQGEIQMEMVLTETAVRMEGRHVSDAIAARDPTTGTPSINFNLDNEGSKIFYHLTGANIGRRLAIVLIDKVDKPQSRNFDDPLEAEDFLKALSSMQRPQKRVEGNRTIVEWLDQVEEWKLISAPTIQGRIGSRGEITGIDSSAEAREIANVLANPLATPLRIVEERTLRPED